MSAEFEVLESFDVAGVPVKKFRSNRTGMTVVVAQTQGIFRRGSVFMKLMSVCRPAGEWLLHSGHRGAR
jgi:hypothetical protein